MNVSLSVRRTALMLALAVLGLMGLAGPLQAADDAPFSFTGTVEKVDTDGKYSVYAWDGRSKPLGACTGVGFVWSRGEKREAFVTLENGKGDSINFFLEWIRDKVTGESIGVYEITGGTGRFADATGTGSFHTAPGEDLTLDGNISF